MRAFIALDLPQDFAAETAFPAYSLKDRVQARFMKPETYHLTLAFLANADDGMRCSRPARSRSRHRAARPPRRP